MRPGRVRHHIPIPWEGEAEVGATRSHWQAPKSTTRVCVGMGTRFTPRPMAETGIGAQT